MTKTREARRGPGRPVTGVRPGEKASSYKRFTMRLPPDTIAELDAAARASGRPQWRVVVDAVRAYIGAGPALSEAERRIVRSVLKLPEAAAT